VVAEEKEVVEVEVEVENLLLHQEKEEKVVLLLLVTTMAQLAKVDVLIVEKMGTGPEIVPMKLEEIDALTVEEVVIWLVNAEKDVERDITHTKEDLGLDLDLLVVRDLQDPNHQENLQDTLDHQKEKDLHLPVNLHLQREKKSRSPSPSNGNKRSRSPSPSKKSPSPEKKKSPSRSPSPDK